MADYKEKIKNLLDLAESPNEHEARAALLKARELMAKYKISDAELGENRDQNVIMEPTGITYSARRDTWIPALAAVIAANHCCREIHLRRKGKQTSEIRICGLEEDARICKDIFLYAVDSVLSVTKRLKRKKDARAADGYGYGFVVGLSEAYEKQEKEKGWALVLVTPEAVKNELAGIPKKKPINHNDKVAQSDARTFMKGMKDGKKFHDQKRISEKNG